MKVEFWGQEFKVNMFVGCIGGFLIAVLSSMFGFGGGPFMVPLMTVFLRLPMYLVVGSSLLAIFFNTTSSATLTGCCFWPCFRQPCWRVSLGLKLPNASARW